MCGSYFDENCFDSIVWLCVAAHCTGVATTRSRGRASPAEPGPTLYAVQGRVTARKRHRSTAPVDRMRHVSTDCTHSGRVDRTTARRADWRHRAGLPQDYRLLRPRHVELINRNTMVGSMSARRAHDEPAYQASLSSARRALVVCWMSARRAGLTSWLYRRLKGVILQTFNERMTSWPGSPLISNTLLLMVLLFYVLGRSFAKMQLSAWALRYFEDVA